MTQESLPKRTSYENTPERIPPDPFASVRVIQIGDLVEDLKFSGIAGIRNLIDLPNFKLPTKIYKDAYGGKFFELKKNEHLETQFFVSQILKGFLPVCELVQIQENGKGRFFSYVPPQNDFEEKNFDSERSLADTLILHIVLGDKDHAVIGTLNNQSIVKGNFLLWDFGYAAHSFWRRGGFNEFSENKYLKDIQSRKKISRETYTYMAGTLQEMEHFYASEDGRETLVALYKKLGIQDMNELFPKLVDVYKTETVDYDLEDWRKEFVDRLKSLRDLCLEKSRDTLQ